MNHHENSTPEPRPSMQQVSAPEPARTGSKDMEAGVHEIQLRYKLSPVTMKALCSVSRAPDRRQVLYKSCLASEFRSFPLKQAETNLFREINDHTAIPYNIKEAITQPWHKVFLLVQVDLLRTGWPNKISAATRRELYKEKGRIYALLDRVLRCLADIVGLRRDGRGINAVLDVLRSVKSGVWEGAGQELLLVDGIGAARMDKLFRSGIKSIHQLARLDFCKIERLMSRNPPYGHNLLQQLAGFPKLSCRFDIIQNHPSCDKARRRRHQHDETEAPPTLLWICRIVLAYENAQLPLWNKNNPWVTLVLEGGDGRLVWFWRGSVKKLAPHKQLVVGLELESGEKIGFRFACEEIVGTVVHSYHQIP
ncbi:meiotic helicase [Metarhizium album ARSEF 1941]|uniref:Meiotic helicase n=1 Tax=Metarhizium album (strain ARSEF 1941) TaxID=1081103 RepID=A0A0B2X1S7_METAS|nr:meiotic helicase [Metarhizium album ARSEF 1941]KHN99085.1 meiotic helicase [Metarhizium album ARSEF 1941]